MTDFKPPPNVSDGDPVLAEDLSAAVVAGELVYKDGATQTFNLDGSTEYVEGGRRTVGEWSIFDDGHGHFASFWPPSYRAMYDVHWVVEDTHVVGLRFSNLRGADFEGRYRMRPS